jgi:hypothetical protein
MPCHDALALVRHPLNGSLRCTLRVKKCMIWLNYL